MSWPFKKLNHCLSAMLHLFKKSAKFYLQDCAVGLLFAMLPVLGGTSGVMQGVISMTKS